jgi:hypothetical protein
MRTLAALLVVLPLAASAQYEPISAIPGGDGGRRSPWYIGFGLGTGDGSLRYASGTYTFKEEHEYLWGGSVDPTNLSLNFKVGATLSPTLLVGFDITAVRSQFDEGGFTSGFQVNNYDAVVTWFPQGEGFFVRGGASLRGRRTSTRRSSWATPAGAATTSLPASVTHSGWGRAST